MVLARRMLIVGLALLAQTCAWADPAYTLKSVNLRAGPARDYPLVAQLPPGAALEVGGCISGYSWCDVYTGSIRGWVYAGNLGYPYHDQRVPILGYGPTIGLPIIAFSLGVYWDRYYRGRPWYGNRAQFLNRPHPGFRPGPGPGFRPGRPGFQRPPVSRPGGRPGGPHGGGARPPGGGRPGGGHTGGRH